MKIHQHIFIYALAVSLSGCGIKNPISDIQSKLSALTQKTSNVVDVTEVSDTTKSMELVDLIKARGKLGDMTSLNNASQGNILMAKAKLSPSALKAAEYVNGLEARLETVKARKDFEASASLYGGSADLNANKNGAAIGVNGSKILYDNGKIDKEVSEIEAKIRAGSEAYKSTLNTSILELAEIIVELDTARELKNLLSQRLKIVEPLLGELDAIAAAGAGDLSKVASAQRTFNDVLVTQENLDSRLRDAEAKFEEKFSGLQRMGKFDPSVLNHKYSSDDIYKSHSVVAAYYDYEASVARLARVKLDGSFDLSAQARILTPIVSDGYSEDTSLGLVLRKDLFNGKRLKANVKEAETNVAVATAALHEAYDLAERMRDANLNAIESRAKVLNLAMQGAEKAREEIEILRKQLVIGISTLDSVLVAEAKLYDAESRIVLAQADYTVSRLRLMATFGLLDDVYAQ